MSTWVTQKLKNVCEKIGSGGTPSRSKSAEYFDENTGHLWVKSKELLEKGISDTEEKITDIGLENSSAKYYPANTVLVAMYGVNAGQLAWLQKPATVNQAICALVVDPQKADWRFVYYSLLNNRSELIGLARGAAQPNLNKDMVVEHEITIPNSISEQQQIASVICAYDDLIENNERRIKVLEEMSQLLYTEWFVKFKFPGHHKVKMVDDGSDFGLIPVGWKILTLENLCTKITDGSHTSPSSVAVGRPMASVKDMHNWGINIASCRYISESDYTSLIKSDCKPIANDVLIAKDGSYLKHIFVVDDDPEYVVLSSIAILRPNGKMPPNQLATFLKLPHVKNRMKGFVSGAAIPRIVLKDFRKFKVLVPPSELMDEWSRKCDSGLSLCRNLVKENECLARTRDLLIPQLVTGKHELRPGPKKLVPVQTRQEVFKEAVLFADFVGKSYTATFFPTHLRTVKYVYFGDRFIGVDPTVKYAESRFGPYNSKSTYAGGEKLALAKKYVQRVQGGFKAGQNIAEINKYTYSERGAVTKVLSLLKAKKDTELELLATVDYIVYSKLKSGETPTERSVFQYISNSPVWNQKITRLSLTEQMVADCMSFLRELTKQGLPYPKHS